MIPQTGIGRFLFFFNVALILALWLVPLSMYSSMPDRVAVEFDRAGNPANFSDKDTIWLLSIIGSVLGVGGLAISHYRASRILPGGGNVATLPEKSRERVHDATRELLLAVFAVVSVILIAKEV